jgi:hypothetical protein
MRLNYFSFFSLSLLPPPLSLFYILHKVKKSKCLFLITLNDGEIFQHPPHPTSFGILKFQQNYVTGGTHQEAILKYLENHFKA